MLFALMLFMACQGASADLRDLLPETHSTRIAEGTFGEVAKRDLDTITLQQPQRSTAQGNGGEFESETSNLVDGERSVSDIRYWLIAERGAVPLESIDVVKKITGDKSR
jgi:hypothetical protein